MKDDKIEYQGLVTWKMFIRAHMADFKSHLFKISLLPTIFVLFIWMTGTTLLDKISTTLIGILWVFFFIAMHRMLIYWSFKRFPFFREPMNGYVSNECLRIENSLGNSEMKWQMFHKFREKDNCLLLYTSPNSFQLLAKEFFASEDDWLRAKEIVNLGIQSRA